MRSKGEDMATQTLEQRIKKAQKKLDFYAHAIIFLVGIVTGFILGVVVN